MSFDVDADTYHRFMGRYSEPLAREFLVLLDPHRGQRALDVGAGTGALTAPLVEALGADAVAAIDPSESFVGIRQSRFPDVDVHRGTAEHLPFDDAEFDLAAAQLVVHFMADPVAGLAGDGEGHRPGRCRRGLGLGSAGRSSAAVPRLCGSPRHRSGRRRRERPPGRRRGAAGAVIR